MIFSLRNYILFIVMLFFVSECFHAQNSVPMTSLFRSKTTSEKITGVILDENKQTVIGANILLKGTSQGATSGTDGHFSLAIPDSNAVLIVSFIGYEKSEIKVGRNLSLKIILKPDLKSLDEVVVTGLFTRKADSYTGSVVTVNKDELLRVGNSDILTSLKNIDPSFQILQSNSYGSDPNQLPDIQMRGASSFSDMKDQYQTSPNQPLFIVNGFEQSLTKVMDLDMNLVKTVTILKDATSKAIYGSKGANGVIVIETELPKEGKLRVSYKGDLNIQYADLTSYSLANAREKLEIERLSGVYTSDNQLNQLALDQEYSNLLKEVERGVNTYWLRIPLQVGIGQKHTGRFEGGTGDVNYSMDISYNDIQGVMKGSNKKTISGTALISYRYNKFLFRNSLSVSNNNSANSPYGAFSDYSKLNPYWRPYNDDGTVREILGTYQMANSKGFKNIYNPLINSTLNTKNISGYTDITNDSYIEWNAWKDLKFVGQVGITAQDNCSEIYLPRDHTSFRDIVVGSDAYFLRGSYTMSNGKAQSIDAAVKANYSKEIGKNVLFANLQWNLNTNTNKSVAIEAQGFSSDNVDYITQAIQYMESSKPTGSESLSHEVGVLGALNYAYDERYLLDYSYRLSGSSLFGADKRWGTFWALGLGWNVHKETFLKDIKQIDQLKVRLSTGFSGSQNFKTYQALSTYTYYTDVAYDNIIGAYLLGLANKNLQWQKTRDNNFGLDLSLWHKLNVTVDLYQKNTDNLLTPVSLPTSTGFTSYTENLGSTSNTGIEIKSNLRLISDKKSAVFFSVFGSLAHNRNKLVKISNALRSVNAENDAGKTANSDHESDVSTTITPSVRYEEGQSMSAIWAVRSLGIDPTTGNEVFRKKDGSLTYIWDANDQVVCGDTQPKVSGTFGFNFEKKGFSVNASFLYNLGGQYYNTSLVDKVENADVQYNVDARMLSGRWSTPGVASIYKKFSESATFTLPTSRFIQNLNELQVTSVNVGYNFQYSKLLKALKIEQLKLTAYMNDVARFATVKAERGTEYPFSRTISGSLQITF